MRITTQEILEKISHTKGYIIFFFALKIAIMIQFILIIANKQTKNSTIYIITEIVFKVALFIFIEWFLFNTNLPIEFEDKIIISFAGGLLAYDAFMNNLPDLLKKLKKNSVLN
jgi:hypothetical protein